MSTVVNKNTMTIIGYSEDTSLYLDSSKYLINPVLPKCESKYWKLNTAKDKILEMTALQKQVVDDAEAQAKMDKEAEDQIIAAEAIREQLIQDRMHDNAEDELIAEGIINAKS